MSPKAIQQNTFIVDFKDGAAAQAMQRSPAVQKLTPVFAGTKSAQFKNIYRIRSTASLAALQAAYGSGIVYIHPEGKISEATTLVNDPGFSNDPANVDRQWGLLKTGFTQAWDKSKGDTRIIVAVIDTGIDGTHEDLSSGQVGTGFDFTTQTTIKAGVNSDDNGHGTLIAGVIAATPNNFRGITGTDWNVTLMPLKALDATGAGNSADVAAAIVYAADHGASIINMSLDNVALDGNGFNDTTLADAVTYAFNKGAVLVGAAGNDVAKTGGNMDLNPVFPVCDDNGQNMVIGVAATDINDQKAQFSNFGKSCVDVSAPGKRILSTINRDPLTHAPAPNSYAYASGTSLAVPFVSGEAALIKTLYPNISNKEIRDRIINSAVPIDSNNSTQCGGKSCAGLIGRGRINVFAALDPNLSIDIPENALVKDQTSGAIFQIYGGQKHPLSNFVLAQRFSGTEPESVPSYVLDALPLGSYALPTDGTLVKIPQNGTVYEILSGFKRPVTFQVWQQRGFKPAQINLVTAVELNSWVTGTFLPPVEGTLVRSRRALTVYWVIDGLLHPMNRGFYVDRGLNGFPIVLLNGNDLDGYAKGNAFVR